jgi:RHS repeat-associated protein
MPILVDNSDFDIGSALVDVNGDGFPDIVQGKTGSYHDVYLWQSGGSYVSASTTMTNLPDLIDANGNDAGVRFGDFNGDGYEDYIRGLEGITFYVYINKADGTGWANPVGSGTGEYFVDTNGNDTGERVMDVNGDGIDDMVRRRDGDNSALISINKGNGVDWDEHLVSNVGSHPIPQITGTNGKDIGTRVADVDGDGLLDFIVSTPGRGIHFYINEGDGVTFNERSIGSIPYFLDSTDTKDIGTRIMDGNTDGIPDFVTSNASTKANYLSSGNATDVLTYVTLPKGGTISVMYQGTRVDTSILKTVQTVSNDPGLSGTPISNSYIYSAGFFQSNYRNRKFAGFDYIRSTDGAGNQTFTYYHQGNGNNTTSPIDPFDSYAWGEYNDIEAKMYQPFRIIQYSGSSPVYSLITNRWDSKDLGNGRTLVFKGNTVNFSYDGLSTHKDSAISYDYATTTGNLISSTMWGEVTGSDNGTFSDVTNTDNKILSYSYASSSATSTYPYLFGLSIQTLKDYTGSKVSETKTYYDNLSLGQMSLGNSTKQEFWKTGSTYASTTKTYNSYGLVTQDKDARGNATNYTYDTYNLYVATSTNALSQSTAFNYDYSSGKVKQTVDPNSRVFQTIYDGLDRIIDQKQPDISSPTSLVSKAQFAYTDNTLPTVILETDYLNSATSTTKYSYFDGLGRNIQERKLAEGNNTYSTKDTVYNNIGKIYRQSLPYFASSTPYTSPTAYNNLYSTYSYDALNRVTTIADAVGTTTNVYTNWHTTTSDKNNKPKDYYFDAYQNLANIVEHNSGIHATTTYVYDLNKNLSSITDGAGNVRNFTYDGLNNKLTAQDLHATGDSYFGTYTYTYDDNKNLSSIVDPKSQTVNYTYDALNRLLTEDYTGNSGTEVTYVYDAGTDGKGRLCTASSTGALITNAYNALGQVKISTTTIAGVSYATKYDYDRQGNQTTITYPDNSQVNNTYNQAGLLESVSQKENGGTFSDVISNLNYSPTGNVTVKTFGNGNQTINTYDSNALYRLTNIFTYKPAVPGQYMMMSLIGSGGSSSVPQSFSGSRVADSDKSVSQANYGSLDQGNIVRSTFSKVEPKVTLEKWGGEVRSYIRYKGMSSTVSGAQVASTTAQDFTWTEGTQKMEAFTLSSAPGMEDGGLKINIVLSSKPATNIFNFSIDGSENLNFLYQDALWKEAGLSSATTTCNDTVCVKKDGHKIYRPDNVVGSYAVYSITKRDHIVGQTNYGTGKIYHIYRPLIIDKNGNKVWGTLSYKGGILSVTVPQSFLNSAKYPVTVDPTFGYTSIGASTNDFGGNVLYAKANSLPSSNGTLTSMSIYGKINVGTPNFNPALYSDSSNAPNTRLAYIDSGGTSYGSTAGWVTTNISYGSISSSTQYWLGFKSQSTGPLINLDSGGTGTLHYGAGSSWNTTADDVGSEGGIYSIYATYTADATSTSVSNIIQNISYGYDQNGNITSINDTSPTGVAKYVNYTYDDLNRLTVASTTSATSTPYRQTWTYDMIGNILTSPQGTYNYNGNSGTSYANPHAPTSITSGTGVSSISFDKATSSGEKYNVSSVTVTHPTGTISNGLVLVEVATRNTDGWFATTTSVKYNGLTLTRAIGVNGSLTDHRYIRNEIWYGIATSSGNKPVVVTFTQSQQVVSVGVETFGGVNTSSPIATSTSSYSDSANHSTANITTTSNGELLVDSAYNSCDNTMSEDSGQTKAFLTALTNPIDNHGSSYIQTTLQGQYSTGWSCANGDIGGSTYAVVSVKPNSYTTSSYNLTYDQNGNLLSDATKTYTWDYRNRLTQSGNGLSTSTYAYDDGINRVKLVEASTTTYIPNRLYNASASSTSKHIFADDTLVASTNGGYSTVSATSLTTGTDTDGNSTATSASISPSANKLILLTVNSRTGISANPNQPTITGNGLTWTAVGSVVYDDTSSSRRRITLFRAMSTSTSAGTISMSFGGQNQTDVHWAVDQISGVNTSGTNGSGAIAQSATNFDDTFTQNSLTVTLSAFSDIHNATYGAFANDFSPDPGVAGSGFSVVSTVSLGSGNAQSTLTEFKTTNDTTVDSSIALGQTGDLGGIAIELKSATTTTASMMYIHPDHLGGTNEVTDSTGAVTESIDYYPYGQSRIDTTSASFAGEKRKYIGEEYDSTSGLNYLNARYYIGTRGQFMSQDPVFWGKQNLVNPQSFNSYSYANGNPISGKDPGGQTAVSLTASDTASLNATLASIYATLASISTLLSSPAVVAGASTAVVVFGAYQGVKWAMADPNSGSVTTPMMSTSIPAYQTQPFSIQFPNSINLSESGKNQGTPRPVDAPSGTKPINKGGLPTDLIHKIKNDIGAKPNDWTGITPDGDVVTAGPDGKTINHGPVDSWQYGSN